MSSFTNAVFEPTGVKRDGRHTFVLAQTFQFDIGYLGSGLTVVVKKGFISDGPSAPKWLLRFIPFETMIKSCAIHDMLREDLRFSKTEGDAIFLTAMCAEGTPAWLREISYLVVRLNGSRKRAHWGEKAA